MNGWVIGVAAVLLPWLTWWPLLTANPHEAVALTPHWLLALALLGSIAAWIGQYDRWLGIVSAYWIVWGIPAVHITGTETVLLIVLGATAIVAVRTVSLAMRRWLCRALVVSGLLQVGYVLLQVMGHDPLWPPGPGTTPLRLVGTLGNADYVGAYLALLTPLAPWWLLPVFALGLWFTKSSIALIAATLGVLVRWRCRWSVWALSGCGLVLTLLSYPHLWASFITRWHAWQPAFVEQNLFTLWFGHGPGSWISRAPQVWDELFLQAHNEYLQWLYEGGLCALFLLAMWIWKHQEALARPPYNGAVLVLAVLSVAMFPFHVAVLAAVAVVVLGLATTVHVEGLA